MAGSPNGAGSPSCTTGVAAARGRALLKAGGASGVGLFTAVGRTVPAAWRKASPEADLRPSEPRGDQKKR